MSHHALRLIDPRLIGLAQLSCSITCVLGAVYVRRTLGSVRHRGFRQTAALVRGNTQAMLDLLMPRTIWGERIGLHPVQSSLTASQAEQVYDWSNDEAVLRWSGGKPSDSTFDTFRGQLRRERWRLRPNQRIFYIVTRAGEFIGRVGMFNIDWANKEAELGIAIGRRHWSQHYGRDAVSLLLCYVFTKTPIDCVYLGTSKDNIRAQRAFAACGFHITGSAERFSPMSGNYIDGVRMEITRQDHQRH